jgi:hypothetical protein
MKPRIFIGSSSEGLPTAKYVKNALEPDFDCVVWNDGTVFGGEIRGRGIRKDIKQEKPLKMALKLNGRALLGFSRCGNAPTNAGSVSKSE